MSKEDIIASSKDRSYQQLFVDIVEIIQSGKSRVAFEVNSTVIILFWSIGKRINDEILRDDRGKYGEEIIKNIAKELSDKFGKGYSRPALFRMVRFAKIYPDKAIVSTLSRQLSWSHMMLICQIEQELKRDFYFQMASAEGWSVRATKDKINSMLFERTAISKKPEEVIRFELNKLQKTEQMTPEFVFRDPYFLDFIDLGSKYSEKSLESAILDNITEFLHEIGNDFCFVARQKRMPIKNKDRYLDLLFFHRGMRRLVAVELKLGKFEPEHKGQMEWYLRWLDKHERKTGEDKPIGIILCSDKDQEDVEYLELDQVGIHVTQYLTQLPPKALLEERLHKAIRIAKHEYESKNLELNSDKETTNEKI
jgi:predicted nuclease of restriction endonuclease-like (RecB) superfamily